LNAAKELSKHLNEWLVVPEEIAKLKKKSWYKAKSIYIKNNGNWQNSLWLEHS
jgi:hypothetical protein